jgi:hypothetical protein
MAGTGTTLAEAQFIDQLNRGYVGSGKELGSLPNHGYYARGF